MTERDEETRVELSDADKEANLIRLVFGGDTEKYGEFCSEVEAILPPDAAAVVRGSSVTGQRARDGAPFDADGPGTSDVDLLFVGGSVLDWFTEDGFYVPGVHSKPLSDEHPGVAPALLPLREKLNAIAGRPVNVQATSDWMLFFKEVLLGQPCLTIVGKLPDS